MAEHETIADIRKDAEAKFRELVEAYMQRRAAFQTTVGAMQAFNTVFDRLEAAHKRERGDCAKLREALKAIGGLCDRLIPTWDGAIGRIKDIAEAALSAPPRNCDRTECATLEMATKTWIREELGPHCNNSKATMGDIRTFDVWIYAPATEKEGGAK